MTRTETIQLRDLATARSGDKGNHATLAVVALTAEGFEFLRQQLTAERVSEHFSSLAASSVERYELPRLWALNFVLRNALAGGAGMSLRIDTQGKLLGTAAMEIELPRLAENQQGI